MFTFAEYIQQGIKKGFGERSFRTFCRVLLLLKIYFRISPGILLFWLVNRIRPRVSSRIIKFKRRRMLYGLYNLTFERSYKLGCRHLYRAAKTHTGIGPVLQLFLESVLSLYGKSLTLRLRRETHLKAFESSFLGKKKKRRGRLLWNLLFGRYYLNIRSYWFNMASTKWLAIRGVRRPLLEHWREREYQLIRRLHLKRQIFEENYKLMRKSVSLNVRVQHTCQNTYKLMRLWLLVMLKLRILRQTAWIFGKLQGFSTLATSRAMSFDINERGLNKEHWKLVGFSDELIAKLAQVLITIENKICAYAQQQRAVHNKINYSKSQLGAQLYRIQNVETYDITDADLASEIAYRYELEEEKEYELPFFTNVPTRRTFEYVKRRFGRRWTQVIWSHGDKSRKDTLQSKSVAQLPNPEFSWTDIGIPAGSILQDSYAATHKNVLSVKSNQIVTDAKLIVQYREIFFRSTRAKIGWIIRPQYKAAMRKYFKERARAEEPYNLFKKYPKEFLKFKPVYKGLKSKR